MSKPVTDRVLTPEPGDATALLARVPRQKPLRQYPGRRQRQATWLRIRLSPLRQTGVPYHV